MYARLYSHRYVSLNKIRSLQARHVHKNRSGNRHGVEVDWMVKMSRWAFLFMARDSLSDMRDRRQRGTCADEIPQYLADSLLWLMSNTTRCEHHFIRKFQLLHLPEWLSADGKLSQRKRIVVSVKIMKCTKTWGFIDKDSALCQSLWTKILKRTLLCLFFVLISYHSKSLCRRFRNESLTSKFIDLNKKLKKKRNVLLSNYIHCFMLQCPCQVQISVNFIINRKIYIVWTSIPTGKYLSLNIATSFKSTEVFEFRKVW